MAGLIGYNDPPMNVLNGVNSFVDAIRHHAPRLSNGYSPGSAQGGGFGGGTGGNIAGLDLGFTEDDYYIGASFTQPTLLSSLGMIRTADTYFGTKPHGDIVARTLQPNSENEGGAYFLGTTGRFFFWNGDLSNRIASDDWIEFASDDTVITVYADTAGGGQSVFSQVFVESGQGEIWIANTPDGSGPRLITKVMDLSTATNGTEFTANWANNGNGGCWAIRRKPGTTGFKLRRKVDYIKGSSISTINFDPPWSFTEDVVVDIDWPANSDLQLGGTGLAIISYDKPSGAMKLQIAGGNVRNPHGIEWLGVNGQLLIPAGGLRPQFKLPRNAKYGTTGLYNQQYLDDYKKANAASARALDQSWPNQYIGTLPMSFMIPPGLALDRAALCEGANLSRDFVTTSLLALPADRRKFMRTFLNSTTSATLVMGYGNEVWNGRLGSGKIIDAMSKRAGGAGDGRYQYADGLHELLDDIEAVEAEYPGRVIGATIEWQTGFAASPDLTLIADRKYKGGTGKTLMQRFCEHGIRKPGAMQYQEAWYFGLGQGGTVNPASIRAALGNNATYAQYFAEIKRQYGLALTGTLNGIATMDSAIRQKCVALGFPATAVATGNYEINRHPADESRTALPLGETLTNAWYDFLESQDLADMVGQLMQGAAQRTSGNSNFLNLHYREQYIEAGYYGLTGQTGVDVVVNGKNGRTPLFNAVSAAAQAANSGYVPPIEVPASYAARTLFRALF